MIQDNMDFDYSDTPDNNADSDYGFDFGLTPIQNQQVQPAVEQTLNSVEQPVVPQQPVDDNWQVRASYFQSQYDKLKNQLDPYMPLIRTLESDQTAAQRVIAALQGQPVEVQQPAPVPQLPPKPVKPEGYSPEEAFTDPQSGSFKYRVALEDYLEKQAEYIAYKDNVEREENIKAERLAMEYQQKMQMQEQQRRFLGDTYSILTTQKGFSPQEAQVFIREMADDSAITLDGLVGYWRYMKGQTQQPAPTPQKQRMPYPAFVGGGVSQSVEGGDPNKQFLNMLRS